MTDEILAWLQFGIENEEKARLFYIKCFEAVTNEHAKQLFEKLIPFEVKHKKMLRNLQIKRADGDENLIKASVEEFLPKSRGEGDLLMAEGIFETVTDEQTLITELFNISIDIEKKMMNIYLELEEQYEDTALKELFHDLAKQELSHKKQIEYWAFEFFGMEPEEKLTAKNMEAELKASKTVFKEITLTAKNCTFTPLTIELEKVDTLVLKLQAEEHPSGFRILAYDIDKYIRPGKDVVVEFICSIAGEFEFYSNVPCTSGHKKKSGKLIVKG